MANSETSDPRLMRLADQDNVLVAITAIPAGAELVIDGVMYTCPYALPLGHKIAARGIAVGERIMKYGAPIGSATRAIAVGEHVHTHNIKSDYLPTHAHDSA